MQYIVVVCMQISIAEGFWYINSTGSNNSQLATYTQIMLTLSNISSLWIRAKFANVRIISVAYVNMLYTLRLLSVIYFYFCVQHCFYRIFAHSIQYYYNYISYHRWPALMGICLFWQPAMFSCIYLLIMLSLSINY